VVNFRFRSWIYGGVCSAPDVGRANVQDTATHEEAANEPALALVLPGAIYLMFSEFDRRRSTYRSDTDFGLAIAKSDFISPTTAVRQLNDGIFDSFVVHKISFA
jgi:hypothetical protein